MKVTRAEDSEKPLHEQLQEFLVAWCESAVVGPCLVCKGSHAHVLTIRWKGVKGWEYLTLCPEGERVLLFKLMRGYLARRQGRNPKIGYNGPIPKSLAPAPPPKTTEELAAELNKLTAKIERSA